NSSTLQVGGALARSVSNGLVLVTGTAFGPVGAGNTVAYGTSLFPDATIFGVPVRRDSGGFVSLGPLQVSPLSGVAFMADGTGSLVTINPMLLPTGPFLTFTGSIPPLGSGIASFGIAPLALPPVGLRT